MKKLITVVLVLVAVLSATVSCKGHNRQASVNAKETRYEQMVKSSPNSKVYLFDYIKSVEGKLSEAGDDGKSVNKTTSSSASKDDFDWAKFYSNRYNNNKTADSSGSPSPQLTLKQNDDYESEVEASSLTECRLSSRTISFKLGKGCRRIQYPLMSCVGYCPSQSMLWKHNWGQGYGARYLEVNTVECCSLSHVWQRVQRVYCLERLEPKDIRHEFHTNLKDSELIKLFQESFTDSKWTESKKVIDKELYSGYFTLVVTYNATCECQQIDVD